MPKFTDNDNLQQHKTPTNHFGFSAASIEDLGASEYTLVSVVIDESGSTASFQREMEKCMQEIVKACKYSPRADNLMLRFCSFDQNFREVHGFKLLSNINLSDYDNSLQGGGMTALYDAAHNVVEATSTYGLDLQKNDINVNGIVFVITDGCDNNSKFTVNGVKKALADAVSKESLESLVSILIGVNIQDQQVGKVLNDFHTDAGFTQYVELGKADAKTLAKLADFVSKSISSQSQMLGTGGPSASLTF